MSDYSPQLIRDCADACRVMHRDPLITNMLLAYANSIERGQKGVTEEQASERTGDYFMQQFEGKLHTATACLVWNFALALGNKLAAAEKKYGYTDGWRSKDWMDECRAKLLEHVAKGDPRDVAAYCAFLWHHGERTALPATSAATTAQPAVMDDAVIRKALDECDVPLAYQSAIIAALTAALRGSGVQTGVTDEVVERACRTFNESKNYHENVFGMAMRAALEAVWPVQAQQDAVAYWAAVADDGELVVAYPADDGNNGEAARTECNQYINDALLNERAAFRLVRLFTHAARPQQASVPDGWVMVPRKITPEMEDAADRRNDDEPPSDWGKMRNASRQAIWDAMLAAAPQPEGE